MSKEGKFDDLLFPILNNVGSVDKFLDNIFSFLHRRTDFFHVKKDELEKLGLPPGMAQKMVTVIYRKYVELEAKAENERTARAKSSQTQDATSKDKFSLKVKKEAPEFVEKEEPELTGKKDTDAVKTDPIPQKETPEKNTTPKTEDALDENENENEKSEDPDRRYYEADPECYNGASFEKYSWAQAINDLDVYVKVPTDVCSARHVKIMTDYTTLKVEALVNDKWEVLLDGKLSYEIKKHDTIWTLDPKSSRIHVHMDKGYERFWEALLEGEPKINVRKIDCSKPFEDLGEEEQAKIQEMMYDQHLQRLGKPSIQNTKVNEIMKKAWNKKGSPFEGQEFDPSKFNMA